MDVKPDVGMAIKMQTKCFAGIAELARGQQTDEAPIYELLDFINERYDCADFRMVCIIKSLFEYAPLLSRDLLAAMKSAVLGFKYWMDEPGLDGMCYWSENHQLLFATVEYLAGQLYPDEVFTNNGMTGAQHKQKAAVRLRRWLAQRFAYGFTEWHSNTYYEEDIAPLALLSDYCDDGELVGQALIILDLLHLDLALHSFDGRFCATSGRCYENPKKDPAAADVNDILHHAFGGTESPGGYEYDYTRISAVYILRRRYVVPAVLRSIAACKAPLEIHDSMGLDLSEIRAEFGDSKDIEDVGMFLWLMEAFTNRESINLTAEIYATWNLEGNNFLRELKPFSGAFLRKSGVLPLLIRILNPATQGIAIQRANTCTYKTNSYMLSTAQRYHPGEFGDQQHIWQATLPGGLTAFSTHPGAPMFDGAERNFSPAYWVGNGINPHSVQWQNYGFSLYDLRGRRGYLEKERLPYTHLYFPTEKFDEWRAEGRVLCGRAGRGMVGVLGSGVFRQAADDEFILDGRQTAYAVVMADTNEYPTLEAFMNYLKAASFTLSGGALAFDDGKNSFRLAYKGEFLANGSPQAMEYPRYDCAFVQAPRKPKTLEITCEGESLTLDFAGGNRREGGHAQQ